MNFLRTLGYAFILVVSMAAHGDDPVGSCTTISTNILVPNFCLDGVRQNDCISFQNISRIWQEGKKCPRMEKGMCVISPKNPQAGLGPICYNEINENQCEAMADMNHRWEWTANQYCPHTTSTATPPMLY